MSWVIGAGLLLAAGFACAFALSEWIVRRRTTSFRDRRLPFESEFLPRDAISWERD
jgi:hypothetical protein